MIASPISRTSGSSVWSDSCQIEVIGERADVESVFSIGGSSLISWGVRWPVAVVEVVAEEVRVVVVVPGVGLLRCLSSSAARSAVVCAASTPLQLLGPALPRAAGSPPSPG